MYRKNDLLDEALALCGEYKKNCKELLKAHNAEKAAADDVIYMQKKLIDLQKKKINLLEERIRLLEGKE